eukprot:7020168-Prymnesium_polylepis.1
MGEGAFGRRRSWRHCRSFAARYRKAAGTVFVSRAHRHTAHRTVYIYEVIESRAGPVPARATSTTWTILPPTTVLRSASVEFLVSGEEEEATPVVR